MFEAPFPGPHPPCWLPCINCELFHTVATSSQSQTESGKGENSCIVPLNALAFYIKVPKTLLRLKIQSYAQFPGTCHWYHLLSNTRTLPQLHCETENTLDDFHVHYPTGR